MRILAINTASEICSVALWDNKSKYFACFEEHTLEHAKCILPLVKEILSQGGAILTDLDALAFDQGPGSFTGVRVGIGIAQGLALGANLPMIGISALATIAQGAFSQTGVTNVISLIDARMSEVYWAEYVRDGHGFWHGEETEAIYRSEIINERLKKLSGKWAMAGTGWKVCPEIVQVNNLTLVNGNTLLPTAKDMLPIACQLLENGKSVTVECAKPIYLKNSAVWKKIPRRSD